MHWSAKGQCSRRDKCGMNHDPENKRERDGKDDGSRLSNSPRPNSLERGSPSGKRPSGKTQPTCFTFEERGCPKRNACYCWHALGSECVFEHADKAGGEPQKRNISVVADNILDCTRGKDKTTSLTFIAKGRLSARGVCYSSEYNFTETLDEFCQEVQIGTRRRTICARAREERSTLWV